MAFSEIERECAEMKSIQREVAERSGAVGQVTFVLEHSKTIAVADDRPSALW